MDQSNEQDPVRQEMATFNAPEALQPGTFRPVAAAHVPAALPPGVPTSLNELPQAVTHAYDLSITAAAEASIPVAGSIHGGFERRVVVLERTAFTLVPDESRPGVSERWGYAVRLCITVNKVTAGMKLTLPFVSASAEVGEVEAAWLLQVVGLAGPEMDAVNAIPKQLNVETFVIAQQSLEALIGSIRKETTRFLPTRLGVQYTTKALELEASDSVARSAAIYGIARRWSRQRLLGSLSSPTERQLEVIAGTYRDLANILDLATDPSRDVAGVAAAHLAQIPLRL